MAGIFPASDAGAGRHLRALWFVNEFQTKSVLTAVSNLNTYNFFFITLGLLLHWRPRNFLKAVQKAMPATRHHHSVSALRGHRGHSHASQECSRHLDLRSDRARLRQHDDTGYIRNRSRHLFRGAWHVHPLGGGKWLLEAPYVMQAANELKVHLGWTVQIYNAAEALPNLINPFFMLPLLSIAGLKVRDIVGFTGSFCCIHRSCCSCSVALCVTLTHVPPVMPG